MKRGVTLLLALWLIAGHTLVVKAEGPDGFEPEAQVKPEADPADAKKPALANIKIDPEFIRWCKTAAAATPGDWRLKEFCDNPLRPRNWYVPMVGIGALISVFGGKNVLMRFFNATPFGPAKAKAKMVTQSSEKAAIDALPEAERPAARERLAATHKQRCDETYASIVGGWRSMFYPLAGGGILLAGAHDLNEWNKANNNEDIPVAIAREKEAAERKMVGDRVEQHLADSRPVIVKRAEDPRQVAVGYLADHIAAVLEQDSTRTLLQLNAEASGVADLGALGKMKDTPKNLRSTIEAVIRKAIEEHAKEWTWEQIEQPSEAQFELILRRVVDRLHHRFPIEDATVSDLVKKIVAAHREGNK